MTMAMELSIGEAATALGVSIDTLRRWDRAGKLRTTRDFRNHRMVPSSEIGRLTKPTAENHENRRPKANRFPGVVQSVESGGVIALVELEAGPFLITAAITTDSVRELGLAPGIAATAVVRPISVMIERD